MKMSSVTLAKTVTAVLLLSQCQTIAAAMSASQKIATQLKTFQRHPESHTFTSTHYVENSPKPSKKSLLESFPESTITRIKLIAPQSEAAFISDPKTIQKLRSKTRTNSRFLRTFPPLELYKYAKRGGSSNDFDDQEDQRKILLGNPNKIRARLENGNSPVFYIRLPPAPYVYVPGIGYVSPHPYSHGPQFGGGGMPGMGFGFPGGPVMMATGGSMMGGSGGFLLPSMDQDISTEQPTQNVISLPLKFLSNGRPHQIESPKKRKPPKQENSSENKGAAVISGGKYSFNGRPTAVFVVRSQAEGSSGPDLSEMTMIFPQK